jgi:hypothetical protein
VKQLSGTEPLKASFAATMDSILDHGRKHGRIWLRDVKYAIVLLERALTGGDSTIPFVLNQENFAMAFLTALILAQKVLSVDKPFSNAGWARLFGISLEVLNSSEEFLLTKIQFQAGVSEMESAAVDALYCKLRDRYAARHTH